MFTAALHPAGLQPPPAFTVTIATTWVYQGFEGKGGQGLSSVQWRNQICSLPRQQLWRLMSSRRGVCGASCLGAAVTRAKICCPHPLWRRLSLTDLETFLSAESRRFFFVFFLSACVNVLKHQRLWNVGFIPGYSRSVRLQSVDLSLFAFFLSYIRSEPTGGRLLYCSHGNCPRKTKRDGEKKKKERNPSLTFRGAAPWTSVGDFSFAKCVF